jgi:predicted signal transduction protein with EAL and GGDEF domain
MTDDKHPSDSRHHSFAPSDFSVREIPGLLLTYAAIAVVCILLGITVEFLTTFWQGFLFGIAVSMAVVVGMSLVLTKKHKQ